ncbi:hypothetical protein BDV93DRAFT_561355 [Ceratobasidium sp. AG-I]|nr:hypothetical protein BDV93DRAFT_561355 [Ceratobasidium sp. AG-I]
MDHIIPSSLEELEYHPRCWAVENQPYHYDFLFEKGEDGTLVETPESYGAKPGKAAFMTVEVAARRYMHNPSSLLDTLRMVQEEKGTPPDLPFRQNLLHNLGSIWWITLWLLFSLFAPERPRTQM